MGLRQQVGLKGRTAGTELFTSILGLRETLLQAGELAWVSGKAKQIQVFRK